MRTAAQRKAAERERKRAAGLVKVELWVLPALVHRVRKYVARIMKGET
jgi:hypothetical protein